MWVYSLRPWMNNRWYGLVLWYVVLLSSSNGIQFKIGGVLDSPHTAEALRRITQYVNDEQLLGADHSLTYIVNITHPADTFHTVQTVCEQLESGVMAIIGPMGSESTSVVAPIAGRFNIPLMTPVSTDYNIGVGEDRSSLVRMSPPPHVQGQALIALLDHYDWTRLSVLTDNTNYGIHGMVAFQAEATRRGWSVVGVFRFDAVNDVIDVTEQLHIMQLSGVRTVILHCSWLHGDHVLRQADVMDMNRAHGWNWIVTDAIADRDYGSPGHVPAHMQGIVGFRITLGRGALWRHLVTDRADAEHGAQKLESHVMDAVLLLTYALAAMINDTSTPDVLALPARGSCSDDEVTPWDAGTDLLRYMTQVQGDGVTADISMSQQLYPDNSMFDLVYQDQAGWQKMGSWEQSEGLMLDMAKFGAVTRTLLRDISLLAGRTIRFTAMVEAPFLMLKNKDLDTEHVMPGDIEGYSVDLLDQLADMVGFNYTVYMARDQHYGSWDPDAGRWSGLVGELVHKKADLALPGLIITREREEAIDFTDSYMDEGMTILVKREEPEAPRPFSFLEPFSTRVWNYILITTALVAVCVSIVNKISPYDFHGHFIYQDDHKAVDIHKGDFKLYKKYKRRKLSAIREFHLEDAVWFSVGALIQQGQDTYPKSLSARLTCILWWLSNMIIVATYTANLAAFLTVSRTQGQVRSIQDLGTQTELEYGTVVGSVPYQMFASTDVLLYKDMFKFMKARNTFLPNTSAAIEKVRDGEFVFIWDSAVLAYEVQQPPCGTIKTVGDLFGKIGVGLGLQKDSPFRRELSRYILHLREVGFMEQLEKKWYVERGGCQNSLGEVDDAPETLDEGSVGKLELQHMLGVFYIIYGGQVLGLLVLIPEWITACSSSVDKGDPLAPHSFREATRRRWRQMKEDAKLVLSITSGLKGPSASNRVHPSSSVIAGTSSGTRTVMHSPVDPGPGTRTAMHSPAITQKRLQMFQVVKPEAVSEFSQNAHVEEDVWNTAGVSGIQTAGHGSISPPGPLELNDPSTSTELDAHGLCVSPFSPSYSANDDIYV